MQERIFASPKDHMKLIITALTIFAFSGCTPRTPTELISRETNYFLIEPDTFLSDFRNRDFSAFEAHGNIRPEEEFIFGEPVFNWGTNDFRTIAEEIHNIVWNETTSGWELQAIQFGWDCKYFIDGPQDAYYSFYKVEETGDDSFRFISNISIVPRRKTITVNQEVFSPVNNAPLHISISEVEASMLEALAIAETNGGTQFRENINGECNVSITYNPHLVKGDGWIVRYSYTESEASKEFYIDPDSGELLERFD